MSASASMDAAAFAGLGEQFARRRLPGDGLLDLGGAHRRDRDAADCDRGARDLAAVDLQQRRRRHDGEIAVAAGELDERRLVAGRPERNADRCDDLVQLDGGGEIASGKIRERDLARRRSARRP